jgi:saccharopine dehydrogenase (NADP+, L-glutamate forming)
MKHILVLGAGQSAPYLIHYLLQNAETHDWLVTVGDINLENAQKAVGNHSHGNAVFFDVNDSKLRESLISKADIVVSMLAPMFHYQVAVDAIRHNAHFISASYMDEKVASLETDALRQNVLVLCEMGLDPGIDHMSAMRLISSVQRKGGQISAFASYGSGIPAPEVQANPLRYCITWNPRNVVRAGDAGALYMEDGCVKLLPYEHVFQRTWPVEVEGVGTLEAYPNRNSLLYTQVFGLKGVQTMIRGTLRYPGWSETWHQIVKLGLPNDTMPIPGLAEMTYQQFVRMFISTKDRSTSLERCVANYLNINPTGKIMENLRWLGLFSDEVIGGKVRTAADVMTQLLMKKLPLPKDGRDMVVLQHEVTAVYPEENHREEKIVSTMIEYGTPGGFTAMSKTVGLPAAIAAKLILTGKIPLTGCHIPTHPMIYEPVLLELSDNGIVFKERILN